MQTIQLTPEVLATTPGELVVAVVNETNRQVNEKGLADPVAVSEFVLAADALNLTRLIWRLREEWGEEAVEQPLVRQLKAETCRARGYNPDEFESAMQAVRKRARLPFGWSAVDLASVRARRNPIRLLDPELATSTLAAAVANVARHLQRIQSEKAILLPIEQLRATFGVRKIVVSGTVSRLIDAGVLRCVDESYHTGKAKEYAFTGKEHEHYEEVAVTPAGAA